MVERDFNKFIQLRQNSISCWAAEILCLAVLVLFVYELRECMCVGARGNLSLIHI